MQCAKQSWEMEEIGLKSLKIVEEQSMELSWDMASVENMSLVLMGRSPSRYKMIAL